MTRLRRALVNSGVFLAALGLVLYLVLTLDIAVRNRGDLDLLLRDHEAQAQKAADDLEGTLLGVESLLRSALAAHDAESEAQLRRLLADISRLRLSLRTPQGQRVIVVVSPAPEPSGPSDRPGRRKR